MEPVNVNDVVMVYEGEGGTCCCGCAGEYYYNPVVTERIAEYVSEHLIYPPKPEQFNPEKIAAITGLVNKGIKCGVTWRLGGLYSLELLDRKYHVRTIAEYEAVRRIKNEQAAKQHQNASSKQ